MCEGEFATQPGDKINIACTPCVHKLGRVKADTNNSRPYEIMPTPQDVMIYKEPDHVRSLSSLELLMKANQPKY